MDWLDLFSNVVVLAALVAVGYVLMHFCIEIRKKRTATLQKRKLGR